MPSVKASRFLSPRPLYEDRLRPRFSPPDRGRALVSERAEPWRDVLLSPIRRISPKNQGSVYLPGCNLSLVESFDTIRLIKVEEVAGSNPVVPTGRVELITRLYDESISYYCSDPFHPTFHLLSQSRARSTTITKE